MFLSRNKKQLVFIYLSIITPSFMYETNITSGIVDADIYSVAYVTVISMDVAQTIGRGLVHNKLAACVNIIPRVISLFEWEGKLNEESETLLLIKTRTSQVDKLTEYVRENHPYGVCEVISLPIKNGNPPYLKWIGDTVPKE